MRIPAYTPVTVVPDTSLAEVSARFGWYCMACAVDGLDPDDKHLSINFSKANPYVHQAIRNGDIEAKHGEPSEEQKKAGHTGDILFKDS